MQTCSGASGWVEPTFSGSPDAPEHVRMRQVKPGTLQVPRTVCMTAFNFTQPYTQCVGPEENPDAPELAAEQHAKAALTHECVSNGISFAHCSALSPVKHAT